MNSLNYEPKYEQPFLGYGRILQDDGAVFTVDTEFGPVNARKAAACLVRPGTGDEVLLSMDESGRCYILSVLEQALDNNGATELDFEGQVNMNVRQGGLTIHTDEDLSLVSEQRAVIASDEIAISASRGRAFIDKMSLVGRTFSSQVETIRSAGLVLEQTFSRLTQRLENAFRFIKDHEEVQTNTTRYLVDDLLALHTKNTDLTSEEVVKVTGDQIHLG